MAQQCPGDGLGISRTIRIDTGPGLRVGTMQYHRPLPLKHKEVVLTFDDGPLPGPTEKVLAALEAECVKATFFMVGNMAAAYPALARRVAAAGHTIGAHSLSHPYHMNERPLWTQIREVEGGFAALGAALGPHGEVSPFFRYPGLSRSAEIDTYLIAAGKAVFSADIVGDDWTDIAPKQVLNRVLGRLERRGRGIILLHDIKPGTAEILPDLLAALKRRGYKIVHIEPGTDGRQIALRGAIGFPLARSIASN
ncbi:MAG: polysaccharide deacetylase family protein [Rhodobiaceae bacterium]|nr:polysaccharide deacetylase family protein [Rhodobiaceae bacterium]